MRRFIYPETPRKATLIRSPSFNGYKPASSASSESKRRTPRRDTEPEMLLRKELWKLGLRYRVNVSSLIGKPDVVFASARVVVSCDGDFWHGRSWKHLRGALRRRANADYWIAKISTNRRRDALNRRTLEREGWAVVVLWENDIRRDAKAAAQRVRNQIMTKRSSPPLVH